MKLDYDAMALEFGRLMLRALAAEAEVARLAAATSNTEAPKPSLVEEVS